MASSRRSGDSTGGVPVGWGASERRPVFGTDTYGYRDREHFEIEAYAKGARAGRGVPVYTGQPSA